jgi:hypothetical protein
MGKLTHYAHSLYQALQNTSIKPKSQTRDELVLALAYPPLRMFHRMGFGRFTLEEQEQFRNQYYATFSEHYTFGDLMSDLGLNISGFFQRCLNEARYEIPSGAVRRQTAENLRRQRETSPESIGISILPSLEYACASRGEYLAREHLRHRLSGRSVMPEQK